MQCRKAVLSWEVGGKGGAAVSVPQSAHICSSSQEDKK